MGEPVYALLRSRRAINILLQGLTTRDAARLFLKCINRQLKPDDFPGNVAPQSGSLQELVGLLGQHPLLQKLEGNPRRICEVATERVVPNGPNLIDIANGLNASISFSHQCESTQCKGCAAGTRQT